MTFHWLTLWVTLAVSPYAVACDEWPKVPPVGRLILEQTFSNGMILRQYTTNGDAYSNYASYTRLHIDGSEDVYPLLFAADFPEGHPLDDGYGENGLNGIADATFINVGTTDQPPPCSDIRLYHMGGPRQHDAPAHADANAILFYFWAGGTDAH